MRLGQRWRDDLGDPYEATMEGTDNMTGWFLIVRASAPVRPNKSFWTNKTDPSWRPVDRYDILAAGGLDL